MRLRFATPVRHAVAAFVGFAAAGGNSLRHGYDHCRGPKSFNYSERRPVGERIRDFVVGAVFMDRHP